MSKDQKASDFPTQPYLITVSNNPAYTGEVTEDDSFVEPRTLEASSIFLLCSIKDEDGEDIATASLGWCINAALIAKMIRSLDDADAIVEIARHLSFMDEIHDKAAMRRIRNLLSDMLREGIADLDDDSDD